MFGRYLVDVEEPASPSEVTTYRVELREHFELGRDRAGLRGDLHLDPCHAAIVPQADGVLVEDLGSTNGVYQRLHAPARLDDGTKFRIGRQLLVYRDLAATPVLDLSARGLSSPNPGVWARVDVMLGPTLLGWAHGITSSEVHLGRDGCGVSFAEDPFVSRRHCRIQRRRGGAWLEDLGSVNGTFKQLPLTHRVPYGTVLLLGRTLVRVDAV